ncbi:hypothetical protein [Pedobacter steynii]
MKRHIILLVLAISVSLTSVQAQTGSLTGAWEFSNGADQHQLFLKMGILYIPYIRQINSSCLAEEAMK